MRLKYVCSILVVYLYPKFQNQFFSYFREDAGGGGRGGEGRGVEVVTWNKSSESNRKKKKKNRLKPKLNQRLYNLEKFNVCLTFLLEREKRWFYIENLYVAYL